MKPFTPTHERIIMTKRPCKHCQKEIYLQFIKITPKSQSWISFDSSDGRLHDCPTRPLAPEVKELIQSVIDNGMKPITNNDDIHTSSDNIEIIYRINRIIDDLEYIRQQLNCRKQ